MRNVYPISYFPMITLSTVSLVPEVIESWLPSSHLLSLSSCTQSCQHCLLINLCPFPPPHCINAALHFPLDFCNSNQNWFPCLNLSLRQSTLYTITRVMFEKHHLALSFPALTFSLSLCSLQARSKLPASYLAICNLQAV